MDEQRTGWRNTPPILLAAFGLDIAFDLTHLVQRLSVSSEHDFDRVDRWQLAANGVWALFTVMVAIGLFDLARRMTGRAAVGLRLAGIMFAVHFVLGHVMNLVFAFELGGSRWLWKVESYAFWGLVTIAALALAAAAWRRRPALAIGGLVLCMLTRPPEILGELLFKPLDLGFTGAHVMYTTLGIVHAIAMVAMVIAASEGVAQRRRELASTGFSLASSALTLRVVAAVAGVILALLAVAAASSRSGGSGAEGIMKFAMFGGLVVNLASFAMFGVGALRAARAELDGVPRWTAAIAAAGSLWCMGVLLQQLPTYYQILYGHGDRGSTAQSQLTALTVAMPIVATLAGAVFAGVIASYARLRANEDLVSRASAASIGYTLLMLASIGIQSFMLENARSISGVIGLMVVAAVCGLVAQVMLARACRSAAILVDDEDPSLPKAVATISDPT